MRVVQRFLGSIARQALVRKEALPRKSSAERGSSALQPLMRAWPSLGELSWAICNLQRGGAGRPVTFL
jgi:hypothetical protein